MNANQQLNLDVKLHKIFDACKLEGKWKRKDSTSHQYISLEEGASIVLSLYQAGLTETFSFKKGANIVIKDSLVEY
ncbi:MAG: hypothetical protein R3230_05530, partial [Nitrosopumilaceae archaeon]|nr:hypothetical protein [Nitrosopumilaceae archaeon]